MSVLHFAWKNRVDAAQTVVTASTSVGDLSPQNLRDPRPLKRWRAMTGSEAITGRCDFGEEVNIDFVALVFPRDTPYPFVSVTHSLKDAAGSIVESHTVSPDLLHSDGYHLLFLDERRRVRYWEWEYQIQDLPYIDTGRAWAGSVWTPSVTADAGLEDRWLDSSTVQQAGRSGSVFVDEGPRLREISFGFSTIDGRDILYHRELQRDVGRSGQMMVLGGKGKSAEVMILGRLTQVRGIRQRPDATHLYQTSYQIREF